MKKKNKLIKGYVAIKYFPLIADNGFYGIVFMIKTKKSKSGETGLYHLDQRQPVFVNPKLMKFRKPIVRNGKVI